MPGDIASGYQTTGGGADEDHVRDAPAVLLVASHARNAEDCALLLEALGLTEAARTGHALRQLSRFPRKEPPMSDQPQPREDQITVRATADGRVYMLRPHPAEPGMALRSAAFDQVTITGVISAIDMGTCTEFTAWQDARVIRVERDTVPEARP